MTTPEDERALTQGSVPRHLLRLNGPVLIGLLLLGSVGIVDGYFVGQLGPKALAAFAVAFPIASFLQTVVLGFSNGITSCVSRAVGAREWRRGRTAALLGLGLSTALAVLVGLPALAFGKLLLGLSSPDAELIDLGFQYLAPYVLANLFFALAAAATAALRGIADTVSSATSMFVAAALNALLTPLLVQGFGPIPALGIAGAALGTALGNFGGMCLALAQLLVKLRTLPGRLPEAAAAAASAAPVALPEGSLSSAAQRSAIASELVSIGGPAMMAQAMGPIAAWFGTVLISYHGINALAGYAIVSRIESLVFMLPFSTGIALEPLVGQNWGAGDRLRASQALAWARRIVIGAGLLVWSVLAFYARPIAGLFSADPAVIHVAELALFILPAGYLLAGVTNVTAAAFVTIGRATRTTQLAVIYTCVWLPLCAGGLFYSGELVAVFVGVVLATLLDTVLAYVWMRKEGLSLPTPGMAYAASA